MVCACVFYVLSLSALLLQLNSECYNPHLDLLLGLLYWQPHRVAPRVVTKSTAGMESCPTSCSMFCPFGPHNLNEPFGVPVSVADDFANYSL